eukprot:scaffold179873_cov30-Tisochrysis_lutea.AAC.1
MAWECQCVPQEDMQARWVTNTGHGNRLAREQSRKNTFYVMWSRVKRKLGGVSLVCWTPNEGRIVKWIQLAPRGE